MQLPNNFSEALGLSKKTGPITALHIFDFDGTLVRTPGPVEGKAKYVLETGQSWSGGWWGRLESLCPPVVDTPYPTARVVNTVFDKMEEVMTRSQTEIGVVVTGRVMSLRPAVLRILDEICISRRNESVPSGDSFLNHDAVFTHIGGRLTTYEFKTQLFKLILTSDPVAKLDISEVHIWEDRREHADPFATSFAEELRLLTGIKTTVHLVPASLP